MDRRDFIKLNAIAAAASAVGLPAPAVLAQPAGVGKIRWDKGVCRFCGTGCSVLVGVKDGRIVATQGDPDSPVNRGLNCIKGYFLSKIMYGKDRLTQPLLRMKNGKYCQWPRILTHFGQIKLTHPPNWLRVEHREKSPPGVCPSAANSRL